MAISDHDSNLKTTFLNVLLNEKLTLPKQTTYHGMQSSPTMDTFMMNGTGLRQPFNGWS